MGKYLLKARRNDFSILEQRFDDLQTLMIQVDRLTKLGFVCTFRPMRVLS